MTGDKDLRTPIGEAESYFAALKIRGIPTRLIPMRNEYHGTGSIPSNYMRTNLMLRKWFDEFDPIKIAVNSEVKAKN
jgi:dipeptidyl aminopeptidase/acylaminoacyl peptidase